MISALLGLRSTVKVADEISRIGNKYKLDDGREIRFMSNFVPNLLDTLLEGVNVTDEFVVNCKMSEARNNFIVLDLVDVEVVNGDLIQLGVSVRVAVDDFVII